MRLFQRFLVCLLLGGVLLSSCREDEQLVAPKPTPIPVPKKVTMGFYLLNEGNMGMNRASLDYCDYLNGKYHRDVFTQSNPQVIKSLGDVGNDLQLYGSKLYAVINVSGLVVVMDARTTKVLGEIAIPNCRYITFDGGKAYVSSYAGPVGMNPNAEPGFVAELDTASLSIKRKVNVGYQPEQMVINKGKLYVANSGGYRAPNYDRTISVIDLASFTELKKIDVAINLHRMLLGENGRIYVSTRGDYKDVPPSVYIVDSSTDAVVGHIDVPVQGMAIADNKLYYYGAFQRWYGGGGATIAKPEYGIWDLASGKSITKNFISDATRIITPYGIAIHPESKDILIADAQDYKVSGALYSFSQDGKLQWKTDAGNIPNAIAFIPQGLAPKPGESVVPPVQAPSKSGVSRVLEYRPAPGQHVNKLPEWKVGDNEEIMCRKAHQSLEKGDLVTLGGFGGYIVLKLASPIENKRNAKDFRVLGNTFRASDEYTSSEPGIVMVAYDANANGQPDANEWYELAGSEYQKPTTLKSYSLTYHKPDSKAKPVPDTSAVYVTNKNYIRWSDSQGQTGYMPKIQFHQQSYYPNWLEGESLTFTGTRLEANGIPSPQSDGTVHWNAKSYPWGYTDNLPDDEDNSALDIEWAVDAQGKPVRLPRIHFVKVYTGVHQMRGWLGEASTDVGGIVNLHTK